MVSLPPGGCPYCSSVASSLEVVAVPSSRPGLGPPIASPTETLRWWSLPCSGRNLSLQSMLWPSFSHSCCGRGSGAVGVVHPLLELWAWFWHSGRGSPIAGAVGVVLVQWAWFTHCWSCGRGSGAVGVVHPLLELWYLVSGPASLELPGWERPPLPPTPVIDARLLGAVLSH